MERMIVRTRHWLQTCDPLGYIGAQAIGRRLRETTVQPVPCDRTIHRVLQRCGVLAAPRPRWPAPPRGWYLPPVADGSAELMQIDLIEALRLKQSDLVEVLTGITLWTNVIMAEPATAPWRLDALLPTLGTQWDDCGYPAFVQSDNDTRFVGSSRAVHRLGRFIGFCLERGVVPVFAPPRESGFQAAVESFNGLWQNKVWYRFHHDCPAALQTRSRAFVQAHHARCARPRTDLLRNGRAAPADLVVFIRRTDAQGRVYLLGDLIAVAPHWPHRLVRCELHVGQQLLRAFALSRRSPQHQPLLNEQRFVIR